MYQVTINNRQYKVSGGRLLSDFLTDNGFYVAHFCGGQGTCGKCKVKVNGESALSCKYVINSDVTVELPVNNGVESVIDMKTSGVLTYRMSYALDIGTTTLALALVSVDTKEIINVVTCTNPQVAFGGDVLSRIDYCRRNGVNKLQKAVADGINNLIERLGNVCCDEMYVSANTAMLHILFGEDLSSMGVAPYTPRFLSARTENGADIGIKCVRSVVSLPCISAFAGADLVAGLNFAGLPSDNKYNLLVDLGTNAEIILYSDNKALCTSAAAGPCFEGANISCGMSATDGAICAFGLDENNEPVIETISDKTAKGLCGTGLVDVICALLKSGMIDETGYMECEVCNIAENVYINQKDIRQYQLAKSAIYSAITVIMNIADIKFSDIENMYISGGFSAKINIENAVETGLLPRELKEKSVPLNNSSLSGTVKYILEQNELRKFLENAEYVDLSLNPQFSELFIENMEF